MRGFIVLVLICLLVSPCPADAAFFPIIKKKDYKQIFLNDAASAEKRKDLKSAFHSYEKALYYYPKDRKILEVYSEFCMRQKYFEKSENLYFKLYTLTKDPKYMFLSNLSAVKNGKLSNEQLNKITQNFKLTPNQKNALNSALIFHYSYKNDFINVEKTCDKLPKSAIGADAITTCIAAAEKNGNKKNAFGYYLRYSDLSPSDSNIVNKIIALAKEYNNPQVQEKYIKKLSVLNPNDIGIKYQLAGLYEQQKKWHNAAKVYEELIKGGDKSEHVKNSLAYVQSELNPKKGGFQGPYTPKPLTGFKLDEKLFYEALDKHDYPNALGHLNKMLRKEPKNAKLLKHKVDIAVAQEKYKDAINDFEKLGKIKPFSKKDEEFMAFLYSKTGDTEKPLEIIKKMLQKSPDDKDLLTLALQYSMAGKNWDKALDYTNKLLLKDPDSPALLKNQGDLYSAKQDFPNAIKAYEKLVALQPSLINRLELGNMYMANQEFAKAQELFEPVYNEYKDISPKIVEVYLNTLLAQQKTVQAYWVIKSNHLENTKDGYMVFGDIAIKDKFYNTAVKNYRCALELAPDDAVLKNKLAEAYRAMGYSRAAEQLFQDVLNKDPKNLEARLGIGSLQTDKKHFDCAREIFCSILKEKPDYKPAKIAIAHSYIAGDDKLSALDELKTIEPDEQTKLMKAKTYYNMGMFTESEQTLRGIVSEDARDLKYKIKRDEAITITPLYSFFFQQLADEFKLDYHKFGINMSKIVDGNKYIFTEYNNIIYSSGGLNQQNNVVNEFRGGIQARPNEDWEYRADIGVRSFEFGGALINTDSWIKKYFNDNFDVKLGFSRNNIEQSYLSAVGGVLDGVFTGRSIYNKTYMEVHTKLPYRIYAYGIGAYGTVYSANMVTNQYFEAMLGAGKNLYENPRNKWIQTFSFDVVSYNTGYQYDQLKIYGNGGQLYGGYFSPGYFNATTGNFKAEGYIKNLRLKWGIKAFGGIQTAISPDQTTPTWGVSPYITYDINDNVAVNVLYNHFTYASLLRDQLIFNIVIRGFDGRVKN